VKSAEQRALRAEDRGLRHPRLRHRPAGHYGVVSLRREHVEQGSDVGLHLAAERSRQRRVDHFGSATVLPWRAMAYVAKLDWPNKPPAIGLPSRLNALASSPPSPRMLRSVERSQKAGSLDAQRPQFANVSATGCPT